MSNFNRKALQTRVVSAPGKAVMAGGYLVLDPKYNAYVTALSSRMHARIDFHQDVGQSTILVESPQFDGSWEYTVTTHQGVPVIQKLSLKNPFLEATLKAVLAYIRPKETFRIVLTLFSDKGYHTQENTSKRVSLNGKRQFLYHDKPIEQVAKTGMGLSAGLVSTITMALLQAFTDRPMAELLDLAHNLAQIAHCDAQGKIGSGFDVAAAIYGSIVYRRFKPETINHLLGRDLTLDYCIEVQKVADVEWSFKHLQCALPPGIKLLMGDVNGGSETPKLVSKVLKWRLEDPQSSDVYAQLEDANESFIRELDNLWALYREDSLRYAQSLEKDILQPLLNSIKNIRRGLQQLTQRSGAEVEPKEQTALLDQCSVLPGCLGGVVPGAGGYDAICLLVLESKLDDLKAASAKDKVFSLIKWLELSEEAAGIKEECVADYDGL